MAQFDDIIRAGRHRKQITIQTPTVTSDSYSSGGIATWVNTSTRWAEMLPQGGSEQEQAMILQGKIPTIFKIRYVSGITPKMRARFNSRSFDINAVINPNESNKVLIIVCEEQIGRANV